jgi:hypothetical protein
MSAYYQEFEELHKLLDRKLGDLRHCYRIEGQQRTLTVYDIFNSQKVNDYLRREGGGKSLVPGEIDERLLQKRFAIAFRVVSQDHGLQNEDPAFCANAQKILNKAREILKDRQKESAYSVWIHVRFRSETEPIEAEKARREAEEERQKRKELEARLAEAEKARRQAERDKHKRRAPARYLIWLGIFLVVGLFQQFGHQHTASNQVRVTPNESTPQPELDATPTPVPTPWRRSTSADDTRDALKWMSEGHKGLPPIGYAGRSDSDADLREWDSDKMGRPDIKDVNAHPNRYRNDILAHPDYYNEFYRRWAGASVAAESPTPAQSPSPEPPNDEIQTTDEPDDSDQPAPGGYQAISDAQAANLQSGGGLTSTNLSPPGPMGNLKSPQELEYGPIAPEYKPAPTESPTPAQSRRTKKRHFRD